MNNQNNNPYYNSQQQPPANPYLQPIHQNQGFQNYQNQGFQPNNQYPNIHPAGFACPICRR